MKTKPLTTRLVSFLTVLPAGTMALALGETAALPSGIYILHLPMKGSAVTRKIIKSGSL